MHLERIGLDDDFFALGGDSIQLFQITARANQSGLPLKAKELLRQPTLGALAGYLDDVRTTSNVLVTAAPAEVALLRPIDDAREHIGELEAAEYREHAAP